MTREITIDAKDKKLGRLASEIAVKLLGKDQPHYAPNKVEDVRVEVVNANELALTEKKLGEKVYKHWSGYPGGLKSETAGSLKERRGIEELLRNAVYGMLPGNKLRKERMKRLVIIE